MANARNYRPPRMVVHQKFVNDGGTAAVAAAVHISGPHANFISSGTDSFEKGLLGSYTEDAGLTAFLPSALHGSVLDTSSIAVVLKKAALRYFRSTTETFVIPAKSKNVLAASTAMQSSQFSFCNYGATPRYAGFQERDVRAGDLVYLTAVVGAETKTFQTSVAKLSPRYVPGVVGPAITAGAGNAATAATLDAVIVSSDMAGTGTIATDAGDSALLLAKGFAVATYTIQTVIGGNCAAARFRIMASSGDSVGSAALTEVSAGNYSLALGTLGTVIQFADSAGTLEFAAGTTMVVRVAASYTPVTLTVGGEYTSIATERAPKEIVYTFTVTKGGEVPVDAPATEAERYARPVFSVMTNTGVDGVPIVRVEKANTAISVGRYGVQIAVPTGYLIEGDKFYVTAKSPYADCVPFINLNDNLPKEWISDADLPVSVDLLIAKDEITVPAVSMSSSGSIDNWALEEGAIRVRPNLTLYDSTWTVGGEQTDLPVVASDTNAYLTGRYFVADLANTITQITTITELDELVSGPIDPSNPLKYAAYHALAGGDGAQVLLTSVPDPTSLEDWTAVTDLISARDDIFHVFPLCYGDKQIIDLFYRHITEMNQDEVAKERVLYIVDNTPDFIPLAQNVESLYSSQQRSPMGGAVSQAIHSADLEYAAFTSETDEVDFIAMGVRAGDVIRTNPVFDLSGHVQWTDYEIADVINRSTVRLSISPADVNADAQIETFEVWRHQTSKELADSIASTAGIQDMLVRYILTDNVDKSVDPIGPAATLVGLIGSVVPHQGVSWYPLNGWSADDWQGRFSNTQMNHMAGNGVLIVTRHPDGYVAARHAVTTAKAPLAGHPETALSLKMSEEMFVRNALLIKKEFRNSLRGFVGVTNLVPGTIVAIEANLTAAANYLRADNDYPSLGGRISSELQDLSIRGHAILRDTLVVSFKVDLPYALNALDCTIFV